MRKLPMPDVGQITPATGTVVDVLTHGRPYDDGDITMTWTRYPLSATEKAEFAECIWKKSGHGKCNDCGYERSLVLGQHRKAQPLSICLQCVLERSHGTKIVVTRDLDPATILLDDGLRLTILDGVIQEIVKVNVKVLT